MEINELEPDIVVCSGDLTTFGFKQEYAEAQDLPRAARRASAWSSSRGTTTPGTSGYVHFEELFGERRSVLHVDGDLRRRRRLVRARPRPRRDRPRPLRVDRGAVRRAGRLPHLRPAPPPAAGARDRPRAERRLRRRRRARGACSARASNLVLSGHKHVPYAWRLENLFVVNAGTVSSLRLQGQDEALLQRDRDRGKHVDVWRKYPFHGQERIIQFSIETLEFEKYTARIEGEVTQRGRTSALALDRRGALPDVVRDALGDAPATRSSARSCSAGARRSSWRTPDYGVPLRDYARARRWLEASSADVVVDLSDEPVLGPRERFRLASSGARARPPVRRRRLPLRPPALRAVRPAVARRDRHRQARREDRRRRARGPPARARARRRRRRDGPRRPGRAGGDRAAADRRRPPRALARRAARGVRLPRGRRALAGVPTIGCRRCGGGLAGESVRLQRRRGARSPLERSPTSSIFDGERRRDPAGCTRARGSSSPARTRRPNSWPATSTPTACWSPTSSS